MASFFGVSERTIRRDIEILSISAPIYTQKGRFNGGVYIMDGYYMDRMYMHEEELAVLRKLSCAADSDRTLLTDGEQAILHAIIKEYSKIKTEKGKKYEK
jgi:predicted DNA-binding transcriptional regulator YafY